MDMCMLEVNLCMLEVDMCMLVNVVQLGEGGGQVIIKINGSSSSIGTPCGPLPWC